MRAAGQRSRIFLDVDGTLLEIAPTPDTVVVDGTARDAAGPRARQPGAVALVSGRAVGCSMTCSSLCCFPLRACMALSGARPQGIYAQAAAARRSSERSARGADTTGGSAPGAAARRQTFFPWRCISAGRRTSRHSLPIGWWRSQRRSPPFRASTWPVCPGNSPRAGQQGDSGCRVHAGRALSGAAPAVSWRRSHR